MLEPDQKDAGCPPICSDPSTFVQAGDWRRSAQCLLADPDAFFPDPGYAAATALGYCANCSVRERCLLEALTNREPVGIWGGMGRKRREALVRSVRQGIAPDELARDTDVTIGTAVRIINLFAKDTVMPTPIA